MDIVKKNPPRKKLTRNIVYKAIDGTKKCSLCLEVKEVSSFHKASGYADGYYSHCKSCHYETYGRDHHFKRTYGISLTDYNLIVKSQGGKCMICNELGGSKRNRLVVDHCHSSGGVRGLICQQCNMALGNARDNPEILRNLAKYLDDYYGQTS